MMATNTISSESLAAHAGEAPEAAQPNAPAADGSSVAAPEILCILKIRVPVVVRLAERKMPIESVRNLFNGAIIEFEKAVTEDLDLLVNNRRIGMGTAVKVGEKFGLRITQIGNVKRRIQSLGS